jgi:thiol:disulfide interchange protein/DsbC/DsbD-like thiol-disulfide interchange protein
MNSFSRFLNNLGFVLSVFSAFGMSQSFAAIEIPGNSISAGKPTGGAVKVDAVEVRLVSNYDGKPPEGETLKIGLLIKHDPHWHTYWRNPGDSGLPTEVQWKLPEKWRMGAIEWPIPMKIPIGPLVNFGFEGTLLLPAKLTVAGDSLAFADAKTISAKVQWLMCKDVCIPGEAELSLTLSGGENGKFTAYKALFDDAAKSAVQLLPGRKTNKAIYSAELGSAKLRFPLADLGINVEPKSGQTIDFFPYRAELIQPAAATKVFLESGAATALGIESKWVDSVKLPDFLDGLLVVNGVGYEVSAQKVSNWVEPQAASLISQYLGAVPTGQGKPSAASNIVLPTSDPSGEPLLLMLGLAFVGGLILNLMPCVFPVLGLKVLGFANHSDATAKHRLRAALLFAAGVVGAFWVLALLMILLQGAGQAIGWGFQLQSPWFVAAMAWLFALIGLNLTGVFEVGISLTRSSVGDDSQSAFSEVGSGVLAVLVATPCTAPFMGAALGAALGQSAGVQFAVFTMLGLGMALPYVLLTLLPGAAKLLPRPGAWMQTLKHFLAFPMFATVAWLVWVFGQQLDIDAVLALLLSLIAICFAGWLYGFWQRQVLNSGGSSKKAILLFVSSLFAFVVGITLIVNTVSENTAESLKSQVSKSTAWEVWSPQRVDELLSQGKPVFVDFTAAWCVSCQVNKKAVLDGNKVKQFFADQKITVLRADWTKRDAEITKELARYKRSGVPMYQVWLPTAGPKTALLLPELLTSDLVISAFK